MTSLGKVSEETKGLGNTDKEINQQPLRFV